MAVVMIKKISYKVPKTWWVIDKYLFKCIFKGRGKIS